MHKARLIGPRLVTARQIARDQGLVELFRRLREKATTRSAAPEGLRKRAGLVHNLHGLHLAR